MTTTKAATIALIVYLAMDVLRFALEPPRQRAVYAPLPIETKPFPPARPLD